MGLRANEMRRVLEIVEWMYASASLCDLHETMRRGLEVLIPGDGYDLVLCAPQPVGDELFHAKPDTYTVEEVQFMLEHAFEHPVARAYAAGRAGALSVSQCVSLREWRNSALYWDGGYRRLGLHHELTVDIPGVRDQCLAAFSVVRGRPDFADRDRAVLDLIRPHLRRAWMAAGMRSRVTTAALLRQLFPTLTTREADVLFWILEGKQNAEIASILDRRLTTIQEHVENLLNKLGMENRHQLTVTALRAAMEQTFRVPIS